MQKNSQSKKYEKCPKEVGKYSFLGAQEIFVQISPQVP